MLEKLLRIAGMEKPERKNVALVLSSGGARGLAHIGAIEVLEEEGYHITSIAGCSMGALIGGSLCSGKTGRIQGVDEGHRPQEDARADRFLLVVEPHRERRPHHRGHHGVCA